MPLHTHYDQLKISRSAPPEVIRAAYRVLAQRYHPDLNRTPDAARIMTLINEAYAVLSDPQRRAEHDAWIDDQLGKAELGEASAGNRGQKATHHAPTPGAAGDSPAPPSPPPAPPPASDPARPQSRTPVSWTMFSALAIVVGALIALLRSGAFYRTDSPGQQAPYSTASVNAVARPSSDDPLHLICEARDIKDNTCSRAKGYPDGRVCDVRLKGPRIEGHFLSPDSTILLVSYLSDCEPHATNWGGSLLFEKRGASIVFKGYHRGIVVTDCTSIVGPGRERLLCATGGMGQGHASTHIAEIVFTQKADGKVEISGDHVISALDSSGAYGANRVECNATLKLIDLASPKPGPVPNTVLVKARYVDAARIRKACDSDRVFSKEIFVPAPAGEAYVEESEILEQWLTLDLATRKLTEISVPQVSPPPVRLAESLGGKTAVDQIVSRSAIACTTREPTPDGNVFLFYKTTNGNLAQTVPVGPYAGKSLVYEPNSTPNTFASGAVTVSIGAAFVMTFGEKAYYGTCSLPAEESVEQRRR
ncbi:MAG TPA: DnaJ domain-containing protein [Burkholderiaceae bacterium]|nr:DnaJ domain-containing protein [Burkholderiaceae bacterium]